MSATRIFAPEHYNTAGWFGLAGFPDGYTEALAELALTLPLLERENGVIGFSIDELVSYHMMHYGLARAAGEVVVEALAEGRVHSLNLMDFPRNLRARIDNLQPVAERVLSHGEVTGLVPLGRMAISSGLGLPNALKGLLEPVHVPRSETAPHRPETFFYPKDGVSLSYVCQVQEDSFVDMVTAGHAEARDYVKNKPAGEVYFDGFKVRHGDVRRTFVALSSLQHVDVIVPVDPATRNLR